MKGTVEGLFAVMEWFSCPVCMLLRWRSVGPERFLPGSVEIGSLFGGLCRNVFAQKIGARRR